jgi:two-component system, chemotaxis family, chemotaxis protein CheY
VMSPSERSPGGWQWHALVLDGVPEARAWLRSVLEREGGEVFEAASGPEALRVMEVLEVDLVVADVRTAEEHALALLGKLRARRPGLPLIAISDRGPHRYPSVLHVAAAFGAGGVLERPFAEGELVAAIRRAIAAAG